MKKVKLLVFAALVMPSASFAQRATCDSTPLTTSPLACISLSSFHKFEEGGDSLRKDSYGFLDFEEPDGVNIPNSTTNKKFGAASLDLSGGNYLRVPQAGGLGNGFWTVALWVRPTSTAVASSLLSAYDPTRPGTNLAINGAGHPVFTVLSDNDAATSTDLVATGTVTTSQWSLLIFTVSPYGPMGQSQVGVSINGGSFQYASIPFTIRVTRNDLLVGSGFVGQIDNLLIAARTWNNADATWYYNNGTGRDFPF